LRAFLIFEQKSTPLKTQESTRTHRLDAALFWLRWLFLAGVVLMVLLAEDTVLAVSRFTGVTCGSAWESAQGVTYCWAY